jgi:hypothetical protein
MKKIALLSFILLIGTFLIGCVTISEEYGWNVPAEEIEKFQGVWKQIDGTSTITFKGNEFDLVDIENGVIKTENLNNKNKKGTFKIKNKHGLEYIELTSKIIFDREKVWAINDADDSIFHPNSSDSNMIIPYSFEGDILTLTKWEYSKGNRSWDKSFKGQFKKQ